MAIVKDMRVAQTGFTQIENMQSDGTDNYNPRIAGQARYFSYLTGYRSRICAKRINGEVVKNFNLPKVGGTPLGFVRSECVGTYEPLGVERWYVHTMMLPLDYQVSTNTYNIITQVHEQLQPNGERTPPWHLAVLARTTEPEGYFTLELTISHDNGTGSSGGATLPVEVFSERRQVKFGDWFTIAVKCKISGAINDYLQYYLNGNMVMDYSGYVGYPAAGNNYLKYGLYSYQTTNPNVQWVRSYSKGVCVFDADETITTATTKYNTPLPKPLAIPSSTALAFVGDNNVRGNNIAGAQSSSFSFFTNDPVAPYGKNNSLSVAIASTSKTPVISYNFGEDGASITSLAGRAIPYAAGVLVSAGDVILPTAIQGATGLLPLGFAFTVQNAGALPATEPTWVTDPAAANPLVNTVAGGITFTATPRYINTTGQFAWDSVNFDQNFVLYEARTALALSAAENQLCIFNAGTYDITNGTASLCGFAIAQIRAFFADSGVDVKTFSPINVTDPTLLAQIAPIDLNLSQAGTIDTSGGFISVLGVSQAGRYISANFEV